MKHLGMRTAPRYGLPGRRANKRGGSRPRMSRRGKCEFGRGMMMMKMMVRAIGGGSGDQQQQLWFVLPRFA